MADGEFVAPLFVIFRFEPAALITAREYFRMNERNIAGIFIPFFVVIFHWIRFLPVGPHACSAQNRRR